MRLNKPRSSWSLPCWFHTSHLHVSVCLSVLNMNNLASWGLALHVEPCECPKECGQEAGAHDKRRDWGSWLGVAWRREGWVGPKCSLSYIIKIIEKGEPDSSQRCVMKGWETMGASCSKGSSNEIQGPVFSLWGWWNTWPQTQRGAGIAFLGGIQHSAEQCNFQPKFLCNSPNDREINQKELHVQKEIIES